MRETPFSVSLENADSLKEVSALSQEMSDLLLKALKTDKRSLRSDLEKAVFKAKLQKYCTLYKNCREKYLILVKRDGKSSSYKEPVLFEKLVRDFNWEKTVTYSKPIKRNEEEEDYVAKILPELIDDLPIKIESDMATIFKRTDPEVIESAKSLTEREFIDTYINTTATEATLKKAYADIRATSVNEVVEKRVGSESSSEVLEPMNAKTAEKVNIKYKNGDAIKFKFAGSEHTGTITSEDEDNKFTAVGLDGTKYPVNLEDIIMNQDDVKSKVKTTVPKEVKEKPAPKPKTTAPKVEENVGDKVSFKSLDKAVRIEMIQELYNGESGLKTVPLIKAKLAETYHIGHYDDVYNMFTKIIKDK